MTPAPVINHQAVVGELYSQFASWFRGKRCRVFVSPVDVKLSEEDVVEPDLVVVCEASKLKPTHVEGAPTLLVEVLSPSTEAHDRLRKMALYARSGVKEVWLVTPDAALVEVFVLDGSSYRLAGTYTRGDKLKSRAFPGMPVNLREVFDLPNPPGPSLTVVKERGPTWAVRKRPPARRRRP